MSCYQDDEKPTVEQLEPIESVVEDCEKLLEKVDSPEEVKEEPEPEPGKFLFRQIILAYAEFLIVFF